MGATEIAVGRIPCIRQVWCATIYMDTQRYDAQPMDDFYREFALPSARWRGKPFWSWNGRLEKSELIGQLQTIKEMGFGGAFLHARTGLATEYLGREWLDLVRTCSLKAAELGLESWLYDEDRWPSGTAGGMVTENPAYRMRYLRGRVDHEAEQALALEATHTLEREPEPGDIVGMWALELDGVMCARATPAREGQRLHSGESLFIVSLTEMAVSSFYNGFTYVDTMNRHATERFLELTHERYYAHSGDLFGSGIQGVFTDEPHRGVVFDGFNMGHAPDSQWYIPYTPGLFERFHSDYGYSLVESLPEIFFREHGLKVSRATWHYIELLQRLFLEGFAEPYWRWCRDHDILVTGHVLQEDSLTAQSVMCGSAMRYYEYMDVPGIDILGEFNRRYQVAKQLQSVMRQTGKKFGMSELYGCTGWQITFEGYKWVGDWQALLGVNLRCPHLSLYSMEGEAKRDYPASILHQSGWWKEYEKLETYFTRFGRFVTQGREDCRLLVINPVESVWAGLYVGATSMLQAVDEDLQKLEESYTRLIEELLHMGVDFDLGDEDMLFRLGAVEEAEGEDGSATLSLGKGTYRAVLLPPMTTVRSSTLSLLNAFSRLEGLIAYVGQLPRFVDATRSSEMSRSASEWHLIAPDLADLYVWAYEASLSDIRVTDASDAPTRGVFTQLRRLESGELTLTAINTNREASSGPIFFKIRAPWFGRGERYGRVEEWCFRTGGRRSVKAFYSEDWLVIPSSLSRAGERAYCIFPDALQPLSFHTPAGKQVQTDGANPFVRLPPSRRVVLQEENVCVLDRGRFLVTDRDACATSPVPGSMKWSGPLDILKIDRRLRATAGWTPRHGEMIQPWFRDKYRLGRPGSFAVRLEFEFAVDVLPEDDLRLVLERPQDIVHLAVNGHDLALDVRGRWIDSALKVIRLPVTFLRSGSNALSLASKYDESSGLEAIYLVGRFGVELVDTDVRLTTHPDALNFGSIHDQGLPFYSGEVTYTWSRKEILSLMRPDRENDSRGLLRICGFEGAMVTVTTRDGKRVLLFEPFETDIPLDSDLAITVHLTRRNTFGPLHHVPKQLSVYGPVHWQSEGGSWSDEYQLWKGGLLSAPEIKIIPQPDQHASTAGA